MEFIVKQSNKKNEITISKELLIEIVDLLKHVECTCVWSDRDQQYIKINDVPEGLVDDLQLKLKLAV